MAFVTDGNRQDPLNDLRRRWLYAEVHEDPDQTSPWVEKIFPLAEETPPEPLRLYLNGTNFQIKVWEALLRTPTSKAL